MRNKKEEIGNEYEVILFLKQGYQIMKVVRANNEHEAVLEVADYLSGDFDLYWNSDDFEVMSVFKLVGSVKRNEG